MALERHLPLKQPHWRLLDIAPPALPERFAPRLGREWGPFEAAAFGNGKRSSGSLPLTRDRFSSEP